MKGIALVAAFEIASRIALAQGAAELAGGGDWIISETTSPVNYTPMVTATTSSSVGSGSPMQLSVYCRGGRTEMVVTGPAISGSGADYVLSYGLNDGQLVQVAAGPPLFGAGAAFKGDVARLLLSLPDEGGMAIRLSTPQGAAYDGRFSLKGLKAARDRVATACKWPNAMSGSRRE